MRRAEEQLGRALCRRLGAEAIPLDLPDFDITAREPLLRRLGELQPTAVINCTAHTQVDRAEQEEKLCRTVMRKPSVT